jgi:hypothetical protein
MAPPQLVEPVQPIGLIQIVIPMSSRFGLS